MQEPLSEERPARGGGAWGEGREAVCTGPTARGQLAEMFEIGWGARWWFGAGSWGGCVELGCFEENEKYQFSPTLVNASSEGDSKSPAPSLSSKSIGSTRQTGAFSPHRHPAPRPMPLGLVTRNFRVEPKPPGSVFGRGAGENGPTSALSKI